MFRYRIRPEDEPGDGFGDVQAPEFFAIGTSPGTPVEAERSFALGSGPTEVDRHLLRAHLSALAARGGLEVLELEPGAADRAHVQAAYDELCRRWHPSKFESCDEDIRELVAEIAIQIENAYREVSNRVSRRERSSATRSDPDHERLARALGERRLESKRSLAKARDAMQRGDIYEAAREFECALELRPQCREAAAGLQLIGQMKCAAHRGSLQRILGRGRR